MSPVDLSRCETLLELDLSENALRYLPRCLHLPCLRRLDISGNRLTRVPLLEQFVALEEAHLDTPIVNAMNRQALAFFCPSLRLLNNVRFHESVVEKTRAAGREARAILEPLLRDKWSQDYASYYRAGVPPKDRIRVRNFYISLCRTMLYCVVIF